MLKLYRVYDSKSDIYDVSVNGRRVELTEARVSALPYGCHWPGRQRAESQTELAPFLRLEADERVEVRVRGDCSRARLYPSSSGAALEVGAQDARFLASAPGAYVLDLDSGRRPLTVFVQPPRDFGAPDALYFGPGVHSPGVVWLESNQTVIIDAEAVVYGAFVGVGVQNVRIIGYGIIDASRETRTDDTPLWPSGETRLTDFDNAQEFKARLSNECVLMGGARFYFCKGVEVEGVTFRDSAAAALAFTCCERARVTDVKFIGLWKYDARGVCIINSQDVRVEGGFARAFGDCVTLLGMRPFEARACERVSVKRVTLWCDWGCAVGIGPMTHAPQIRDVLFEDIDIISTAHACMDIRHGCEAEISRVEFRGIRCEYPAWQRLPIYQTDMRAAYREARAHEPAALVNASIFEYALTGYGGAHGDIRDVRLRDLSVTLGEGVSMPEMRFSGLNSAHIVRNVSIDALNVNGARVTRLDDANIMVNAFASKIVFA